MQEKRLSQLNSDWQVYEKARLGDEQSWTELVNRFWPGLYRTAVLITGDLETAHDVVQDSLVKIIKRTPPDQRGTLGGYLAKIVYHQALKEKKLAERFTGLPDLQEGNSISPLAKILKTELDQEVVHCINLLEDTHREILILRFYGNHSYEQIAEITGLPVGTVKSRMFNGVKKCREVLADKGLVP